VTPRLTSRIQVSALIRRVEGQGGHGMVLARGDGDSGTILLLMTERGVPYAVLERALTEAGDYAWRRAGPQNMDGYQEVNPYIERRRASDGDLWVIELDVAGVERFTAEMIATG
jgi:hypothetical protein